MSKLVQISTKCRRIGLDPTTLTNHDPVFGQLINTLATDLTNVTSSGDRAITQAKDLARSISFLEKRIAELEMDRDLQSDTRARLIILGRELICHISELESAVRDVRNNTIAFERMKHGRRLIDK